MGIKDKIKGFTDVEKQLERKVKEYEALVQEKIDAYAKLQRKMDPYVTELNKLNEKAKTSPLAMADFRRVSADMHTAWKQNDYVLNTTMSQIHAKQKEISSFIGVHKDELKNIFINRETEEPGHKAYEAYIMVGDKMYRSTADTTFPELASFSEVKNPDDIAALYAQVPDNLTEFISKSNIFKMSNKDEQEIA